MPKTSQAKRRELCPREPQLTAESYARDLPHWPPRPPRITRNRVISELARHSWSNSLRVTTEPKIRVTSDPLSSLVWPMWAARQPEALVQLPRPWHALTKLLLPHFRQKETRKNDSKPLFIHTNLESLSMSMCSFQRTFAEIQLVAAV